jgi:UDP-N-acetyl-2-amino-2-deoxyglucuronate dehydrogenase
LKRFAIIGAAGYVAPRHMHAIRETGNILVAALDKHDSVGVLDNYFPQAEFFTEFERFDRYLDKLRRNGNPIDYLVICSPNYLHDSHIRFGLRLGVDVICEKPVVLNPWNVDALLDMEKETGKKVFTILQLRLHPAIQELREKVLNSYGKRFRVSLKYITPRGNWYYISWKGDIQKSGGITTNIGVHFFDLLLWIFGEVQQSEVTTLNSSEAAGKLYLQRADVDWSLSINSKEFSGQLQNGQVVRSLKVDDEEIDFSTVEDDLHVLSYKRILENEGFSLKESKRAIELLYSLRQDQNKPKV